MVDFAFDFFAVFLWEGVFAFLRPPDVVVDALGNFFLDRPSDVVTLATDLSTFIGVPLRNHRQSTRRPRHRPLSSCRLFANDGPGDAARDRATGPPTIAPSTAPVTPPTACLETEMFLSAGPFDDVRVVRFLDLFAIVHFSIGCVKTAYLE